MQTSMNKAPMTQVPSREEGEGHGKGSYAQYNKFIHEEGLFVKTESSTVSRRSFLK